MKRIFFLLSVLLLVNLACDKGASDGGDEGDDDKSDASERKGKSDKPASSTPKKKKKVEIEWSKPKQKFNVAGKPKLYGDLIIFKGTYQVTIHGFPKGTAWSVGDLQGRSDSAVLEIIKVKDMQDQFGQIPIGELKKFELDPKAKLEVIEPGGDWFELELPAITVGLSLEHVLEKVANGAVKFGDEKDDPKPGTSILLLHGFAHKVFGQASILSDVDAVAIPRVLEEVKGTKTCSGYKDNSNKAMPDIELQLKETEVVVYDRRKGGELQRKVFPPDDNCPMYAFQKQGDNKKDSSIPTKAIESWLQSQAK